MARAALITAGTAGLGLGIAERLVADGFDVAITGRDAEKMAAAVKRLQGVGSGARVFGIVSDLRNPKNTEMLFGEALEYLSRIDCLVVNSGHMPYGTIEDIADDLWFETFEMLLMSTVRIARGALRHMRRNGIGDIVFITGAEAREPAAHLVLASTFRAAIANMAKILAKCAGKDNIRVNVVAPGYFDTGRVRGRIDALASERGISRGDAMASVAGDNPLGRVGNAEEIGELVGFICSRKAEFLNGTTVVIDGGKSISFI